MTAHWGINDPARIDGDIEAKQRAFSRAFNELRNRLLIFVNLPLESLDKTSLQQRLDDIGSAKQAQGSPA
jgi:arsenate reductase